MRRQYRFEEFLLGASERRLFRTPLEPVELSGKPFDLLLYLVERPNTLLTRAELLDAVWGQVNVSDQSLTEAISRLRKTLDPTRPERFIQTVAGKGYRFVAAVAAVHEGVGNPTEGPKRKRARAVLYAVCSTFVICLGVGGWFASRPEREAHRLLESALLVERSGDDALAADKLRQALRLNPAYDAATLRLAWILYQDDQDDAYSGEVGHDSGDSGPLRSEATDATKGEGEMDLSSDGRTCRRNTSIIISFLGFTGSILAPWSGVPFLTKAALSFAGNMAHGSGPLPAESWPNRTGIRNPQSHRASCRRYAPMPSASQHPRSRSSFPEDSWKRDNLSGFMGKKSIAIVAIVLVAFFVLGYVHGTSDAKQPDALLHDALRFSHFSLDDQKQVNLVYSCKADIYVWNVRTKQYSITAQEAS